MEILDPKDDAISQEEQSSNEEDLEDCVEEADMEIKELKLLIKNSGF